MSGPLHLSDSSREEHLAKVAKLDRRGWRQWEIAKELGVTQQQVSYDLKQLRKRYVKEQMWGIRKNIAQKLAQYAEVRAEAWAAYERSQRENIEKVVEKGIVVTPGEGTKGGEAKQPVIERTKTIEGRLPAAEYLRVINETLKAERELLGLDQEQKAAHVGVVTQVNWNPEPQQIVEDPIEAKIRELTEQPKELRNGNGQPAE